MIDTNGLRKLYDEDADLPAPFDTIYHIVLPACLDEIDRLRAELGEARRVDGWAERHGYPVCPGHRSRDVRALLDLARWMPS